MGWLRAWSDVTICLKEIIGTHQIYSAQFNWCSGDRAGRTNEVWLRRFQLVTTYGMSSIPSFSRPLSLAIPPWVGATSAGDGFCHLWGRNSELCVAVGLATRTAGIVAEVG